MEDWKPWQKVVAGFMVLSWIFSVPILFLITDAISTSNTDSIVKEQLEEILSLRDKDMAPHVENTTTLSSQDGWGRPLVVRYKVLDSKTEEVSVRSAGSDALWDSSDDIVASKIVNTTTN